MKATKEQSALGTVAMVGGDDLAGGVGNDSGRKRRLFWLGAFALVLTGAFALPLFRLFRFAMGEEIHSHVVLIPVVTGWLLWTERGSLRVALGTSVTGAAVCGLAGLVAVVAWWTRGGGGFGESEARALVAAGYLCLLAAGAFLFLGPGWMWKAAFPVCFLVFMIPLPDRVVAGMEMALMVASAEASDWLFQLTGTPVFRVGQHFQLPGFSLSVAQECSGIRSSWVLFITSLLASHLFLRTHWKRALLVAVVIPLGVLRNGLRIVVIGLLCVHKGPHMIDSWIHHRGGPLFFVVSLVPLFLLLWWLRRSEVADEGVEPAGGS